MAMNEKMKYDVDKGYNLPLHQRQHESLKYQRQLLERQQQYPSLQKQHHYQQINPQQQLYDQHEKRLRKEQNQRQLQQQHLQLSDRIQDWVKPPHYKGAWHTFHEPDRLLQFFLEYADNVNGIIHNTFNISIATPESEDFEILLSPMCASGQEDLGLFLPFNVINQLGLSLVGEFDTRNYGRVKTYSSLLFRLESPRCKGFIYKIPDGYIYELPEIFSSASLAAVTGNGNPQRQGILHRELLYQHAVVFYNNYLYALSEETYNSSGIPEVMFRNARCEVLVPGKNGKRMQKINLNNILRRMSVQRELDAVHPCFQNDFYIKELIAPPFVYYAIVPKCFHCNNTERLFYCSLCRKRHVQTPHVYCSKNCQKKHWVAHHAKFHADALNEQQIYVTTFENAKRVEMQICSDTKRDFELQEETMFSVKGEIMTYEHYICLFIVFYGCFWYFLKIHTDDEQDL